ncbi:trypsin-like serine protease [Streptomyces sp. NPDC058674]|uniref:trypsin-like serine protease n=1 Tax=Streptomyces sp. NPDC058674 TaxID=3346592 RepID=UPI0036559AFD
MKYKLFSRSTVLGISLAVSGSLLVLSNLDSPETAQPTDLRGAFSVASAENAAMIAQAPISEAANEIYQAAQEDADSGYAGTVLSMEDKGYRLSWKGEVPKTVASLIEAHRAKGINVTVAASRYTFKELDERARAIVESGVRVAGAAVTSAGASSDGNSLNIGVDSSSLPPGMNVLNDRATLDSIPKSVTGGFPLSMRKEGPVADYGGPSRYADGHPYYGGSFIRTSSGTCTAGFSAYSPQTNRRYLLTAGHCFKGDGVDVRNGERSPMGKMIDLHRDYDSALIELPDGSSATPYIYTGYRIKMPVQSGQVRGIGRAFEGESLCVSGALLGEACGAKVTLTAQWVRNKDGELRHVDKLEQVAGRYLAGEGDSGGPVFARTVGGISARGVMSMGIHNEPCKNPLGGRRSCSESIWVTNIHEGLSSHYKKAASLRVDNFGAR